MTQPTALYLADVLVPRSGTNSIEMAAASELRRLYAELERCKQVCAATSEGWRVDAEIRRQEKEMNRDVCEHFNPVDLPCVKCSQKRKSEALFLADELEMPLGTVISSEVYRRSANEMRRLHAENEALKAALSEPVQESVAMDWLHKWANQDDGEPETQWHEGYEAARRVVQIHLTAPPQRKPLTTEQILDLFDSHNVYGTKWVEFARAIEKAHGIK